MEPFRFLQGHLHVEEVSLADVAARYGTPCYVYSRAALEQNWSAFEDALTGLNHLICYAVKANSNLAVLDVLARLGSGFDIVSAGELERVIAAGGDPGKIVFSGVGKSVWEMERGLDAGIHGFNVESTQELETLNLVARERGRPARVSLRVNPDVDPDTHPYIATGLKENKFGIPIADAIDVFERAAELTAVDLRGIDCHIGSQLTALEPFADAITRVLDLVDDLTRRGFPIADINFGGGLGIRYRDESPPAPVEYVETIRTLLADRPQTVLIEPGRSICGNAGILLTTVQYLKTTEDRNFAIVDAAMNDFIRPALYDGWSAIRPVVEPRGKGSPIRYDVVGPVCESADFLGRQRDLDISQGDLLAVESAGAYGFSMSSNYNSRPRAPEVMADGSVAHLIRPRESIEQLYAGEAVLPAQVPR